MTDRGLCLMLALALSTVPAAGSLGGGSLATPDSPAETRPADRLGAAIDRNEPRQRVLDTARAAIDAYPEGAGGLRADPDPMLDSARSNLDTTETVLAIAESDPPSALERSVDVAAQMTNHHAQSLGVPSPATLPVPELGHERASRALAALAAQTDTTLNPEQRARLAELDELPAPVDRALARLVDAHRATVDATERALPLVADLEPAGDGPSPRTPSLEPGQQAPAAHALAALLAARTAFLDATVALEQALDATPDGRIPAAGSIAVPPAFALDLQGTDEVYAEDVALLVDAGGNDTYRNNAGGSGVDVDCQPFLIATDPTPPQRQPMAAAAVDLGGDDRYVSERDCGINGGGQFGVGHLVDDGGDDVYRAGDQGINGGGQNSGLGLLVDTDGSDTYKAGDKGTNGGGDGAAFTGQGLGLLVDGGGADVYEAGASGTNGGGWAAQSVGALVDLGGSDTYTADHFSTNGGGWIGEGFLLDTAGDDRYAAGDDFGTVGVNGGAQFGVGFLYDDAGNDTYVTAASGVHDIAENGGSAAGVSLLLDADGRDVYRSSGRGGNGGVANAGLAVLADGSGDDRYVAGAGASNGGVDATVGPVAVLADGGGNDTYLAKGDTANGAAQGPGTAVLLDRNGEDRYRDGLVDCTDCTRVPKGQAGAQVDR